MSEHMSGAVSREYHIAVIEKKDRELSALKAQRDELLIAIKALRGDKPCGHNYTCCCPDDLATAAILSAEPAQDERKEVDHESEC